jgi:hypothetical protein
MPPFKYKSLFSVNVNIKVYKDIIVLKMAAFWDMCAM